jgi:hypothetical protein
MPSETPKHSFALSLPAMTHRRGARPPIKPFAYYSAATATIYVRPSKRDVAIAFLGAHVKGREWEFDAGRGKGKKAKKVKAMEAPLSLWDPAKSPVEGDIKLTNGECVNIEVQHKCTQIGGVTPPAWMSTPKITYGQCTGASDRPCADSWQVVFNNDQISIFDDAACTKPGVLGAQITLYDWVCVEL